MPRGDRSIFGCLQHAEWCLWHTPNKPQNEMAFVSTRLVLAVTPSLNYLIYLIVLKGLEYIYMIM